MIVICTERFSIEDVKLFIRERFLGEIQNEVSYLAPVDCRPKNDLHDKYDN